MTTYGDTSYRTALDDHAARQAVRATLEAHGPLRRQPIVRLAGAALGHPGASPARHRASLAFDGLLAMGLLEAVENPDAPCPSRPGYRDHYRLAPDWDEAWASYPWPVAPVVDLEAHRPPPELAIALADLAAALDVVAQAVEVARAAITASRVT